MPIYTINVETTTSTQGYVYLIRAGNTDRYKIGRTRKLPEERLKQLNGQQSSEKLELIHSVFVDDTYTIEKNIHAYFYYNNHHNEWFRFSSDVIPEVIKMMNDSVKYVSSEEINSYDFVKEVLTVLVLIGFIFGGLFLTKNPKYADCLLNKGGTACNKLLTP